jgi:DNA-directed RNA polymerase subunit E'/Rpb7
MGKRKEGETKEEKRERKRQKKEAKRRSSEAPIQADESQEDSIPVFFRKSIELNVSLLPSALSDVKKNIEDSLRAFLLKYSEGVKGILLAFDNVELLGKGAIFNELPHIHYTVAVDAVVFAPSSGCSLEGVVKETSFPSHLSLTVLNYFNASIAAQEMKQAGFEFEDEAWTYQGRTLEKGDAVSFVCQKMYESGGIISIAGSKPSTSER